MKLSILALVNSILAIGVSVIVWRMLPYAYGVACDARINLGEDCLELTTLERVVTTLAPVIFISILVAFANWLNRLSGFAAKAILVIPLIGLLLFLVFTLLV